MFLRVQETALFVFLSTLTWTWIVAPDFLALGCSFRGPGSDGLLLTCRRRPRRRKTRKAGCGRGWRLVLTTLRHHRPGCDHASLCHLVKAVDDLLLDAHVELLEKFKCLFLIFNQWIPLAIPSQPDPLPQMIHMVEMLHPERIDAPKDDRSFNLPKQLRIKCVLNIIVCRMRASENVADDCLAGTNVLHLVSSRRTQVLNPQTALKIDGKD